MIISLSFSGSGTRTEWGLSGRLWVRVHVVAVRQWLAWLEASPVCEVPQPLGVVSPHGHVARPHSMAASWQFTALIGSVLVQAELPFTLCEFALAAVTKYCLLRALNTRTSFSHSFGCEKPQIKMLAGLISSFQGLFPWLVGGRLSLISSCGLSSKCVCVLISFYKDTSHRGSGSTLVTPFYLNYLFKNAFSRYSDILRCRVSISIS